MTTETSAPTAHEIGVTFDTLKCMLNNTRLQVALDQMDGNAPDIARGLDQQLILASAMELVAHEGIRLTTEEP